MWENTSSLRIEPGLGVARLGNSPEYFIGPEVPGDVPNAGNPYKDASGGIKRQAARFRIYAYDAHGQVLGEVTERDARIRWRVHPANRKAAWYQFINAMDLDVSSREAPRRNPEIQGEARRALVIDPGAKEISGTGQGGDAYRFTGRIFDREVYLGEILTDDAGRLLVLGGIGRSESRDGKPPTTFANNDGWFDDTSDGTVRATVEIGGRTLETEPAMYAAVPPNFAPGLKGPLTMYDVAMDLFVSSFGWPEPARPDFHRDIYPLFRRLSELESVNQGLYMLFGWGSPMDFRTQEWMSLLADSSEANRPLRQRLYSWFRSPDAKKVEPDKLPPFYGDTFSEALDDPRVDLRVTRHQYEMLDKWADGDFDVGAPEAVPASLEMLGATEQVAALNRAALEDCLGGPFHPGIELTWTMRLASVWSAPFRLKIAPEIESPRMDFGEVLTAAQALAGDGPLQACYPGTLTWWLGIPWQTDEASCDAGYTAGTFLELPSFWAARVPNHVLDQRSLQQLAKEEVPLPHRIKHLSLRHRWLRFLREPYLKHIEDMVSQWHLMGIVVPQATGSTGNDLPEVTGVETEVAARLTARDPSWKQQEIADAGSAPAITFEAGALLEAELEVQPTRYTHRRDERG